MRHGLRTLSGAVMALLSVTPVVGADPITVTSGFITLTSIDFNAGDNSSGLVLRTAIDLNGELRMATPSGVPGYPIDGLGSPFSRTFQIGDVLNGFIPFDVLFPPANYLAYDSLQGNIVFTVTSGAFTLSSGLQAVVPFSLTGYVTYCHPLLASCPARVDVFGSGNATFQFGPNAFAQPSTGYRIASVDYEFSAPPDVPEPTSAVLLASGLAGLARVAGSSRWRLRRRTAGRA